MPDRPEKDRATLQKEIAHQELALTIIHDVGKTLTSTLQLTEVLKTIADRTSQLIPCEAWSLLLLDENTRELTFEIAVGPEKTKVRELKIPLGQGVAGWVAQEGQPLLISRAEDDPRFFRGIDRATGYATRSLLCVPLISKGKILGVIELINKVGDSPFDHRDLALVTILADYAAIAIENARLYQKAEELAITDDVTRISNMRYFHAILDRELSRSIRKKSPLSLLFIDLDHFKQVNDTYGHLCGSRVLKEVAHLLRGSVRATDLVARYGGDEFVILLPDTDSGTAFRLAERLRETLASYAFLQEINLALTLTASFGVATFPEHAASKDELILWADRAMYRAKGIRRNLVYSATDLAAEEMPLPEQEKS